MIRALFFSIFLSLTALLLSACSSNPPPPLHLYQLSATAPAAAEESALTQSLGIGPLLWPDYLKGRKLIQRLDANRITTLEDDRWAEPLDTSFERTLRENLARLLQPPRLQTHPWSLADAPALQVPIEIQQLDTSSRGETVLRARWRIIKRDKSELLPERSSEIRLQAQDTSPAAAVIAQSAALARLSEEIARQLNRTGRP